jgi:hypothetical protein
MKKGFLLLLMVPLFGLSNNNQEMFRFRAHPPEKDSLSVEDDLLKRFSAGIKFGAPYMTVVGAQYTLPFFNNHFAPYLTILNIRMRRITKMPNFVFLNGVYPIFSKKEARVCIWA